MVKKKLWMCGSITRIKIMCDAVACVACSVIKINNKAANDKEQSSRALFKKAGCPFSDINASSIFFIKLFLILLKTGAFDEPRETDSVKFFITEKLNLE